MVATGLHHRCGARPTPLAPKDATTSGRQQARACATSEPITTELRTRHDQDAVLGVLSRHQPAPAPHCWQATNRQLKAAHHVLIHGRNRA